MGCLNSFTRVATSCQWFRNLCQTHHMPILTIRNGTIWSRRCSSLRRNGKLNRRTHNIRLNVTKHRQTLHSLPRALANHGNTNSNPRQSKNKIALYPNKPAQSLDDSIRRLAQIGIVRSLTGIRRFCFLSTAASMRSRRRIAVCM